MTAADISVSIEDEEDRKEANSKIIKRAIKIAPSFALEVYPRCGSNLDTVFWELEQILHEYAEADRDLRKWLLSWSTDKTQDCLLSTPCPERRIAPQFPLT